MFSIVTVASSTRMPTASASPPSVMTLIVSPSSGEHRHRRQDGERDRDGDDQGRAPAAEEQQDHHPGQRGRDRAFADHARDGAGHEHRLIADGRQIEARRQGLGDAREQLLDAGNDRQGRGRARLDHRQQHGALAVDVDDIGLRRAAVMHVGDVAHVDDRAIDGLDRQIVEGGDRGRRIVQIHRVFELADLLGADRGDQVLDRQGVDDVVRGDAVGVQRLLVEVGLDLPDLAAIGQRNRRRRRPRPVAGG